MTRAPAIILVVSMLLALVGVQPAKGKEPLPMPPPGTEAHREAAARQEYARFAREEAPVIRERAADLYIETRILWMQAQESGDADFQLRVARMLLEAPRRGGIGAQRFEAWANQRAADVDPLLDYLGRIRDSDEEIDGVLYVDLREARRVLEVVASALDEVEQRIDARSDNKSSSYKAVRELHSAFRPQIDATEDALEARSDHNWGTPMRAKHQLRKCERRLSRARERLEDGAHIYDIRMRIKGCLGEVDELIERADAEWFLATRVAPVGGSIAFLWGGFWFFRRRAGKRKEFEWLVDNAIADWQERLDRIEQRLENLRADHPDYFAADGELSYLDERTRQELADTVNLAHSLRGEARERLDAARRRRDEASMWSMVALVEARKILLERPVEIEPCEPNEDFAVRRPLERGFETSGEELVDNLDRLSARARERLAKL